MILQFEICLRKLTVALRASNRHSFWEFFDSLVRNPGRHRISGRPLDGESSRLAQRNLRRHRDGFCAGADGGCDCWRANFARGDLLEGRIFAPAVDGSFHDSARRAGVLRRLFRGGNCNADLHAAKKNTALEIRRCARAKRCTRPCVWPDRLFDDWLLLWKTMFAALGNHVSGGTRDASSWSVRNAGSSRADLRIHFKFCALFFPGVALSAKEIRQPYSRSLPAWLRGVAFVCGNFSRRLQTVGIFLQWHDQSRTICQHRYFCGRADFILGEISTAASFQRLRHQK